MQMHFSEAHVNNVDFAFCNINRKESKKDRLTMCNKAVLSVHESYFKRYFRIPRLSTLCAL